MRLAIKNLDESALNVPLQEILKGLFFRRSFRVAKASTCRSFFQIFLFKSDSIAFDRLHRSRGFTLLEILIVVGIIAAVLASLAPRLRTTDGKMKVAIREFTSLGRDIRNQARLRNATHRLVVSFDKENPEYWVEMASGPTLLKPQTEIITFEREREEAKVGFSPAPRFKKKKLPTGLHFIQLETQYNRNPITESLGYVHFSPQGLVEESVLQFGDGKNRIWSILFNPLTGQAQIYAKAVQLNSRKSN